MIVLCCCLSIVNGSVHESLDDIGWVWADCVIETVADRGTFTSLVNAGFVAHNGHGGRDSCVTLTAAGFTEYQRIFHPV